MVVGNALVQTDTLTVEVSNGMVVTLIVLTVSQPLVVLATVSIREPAALKRWPSIVVGNAFSQTLTLTVSFNNALTVRFNITIVSHPFVVLPIVSV